MIKLQLAVSSGSYSRPKCTLFHTPFLITTNVFDRCDSTTAYLIPDEMSFSTAAALPVSYPTAYYAIMHAGRMKVGETILIHSGAGGLGQACIQISKLLQAEIFVTVGTDEKKRLLMDTYGIPEDHIFSSRTPAFGQGIKKMTNGRGVDIVINSLAGEAMRISWECMAPLGRFIETGKRDILSNANLPMHMFLRNVSFIGVDLNDVFLNTPEVLQGLMKQTMALIQEKKITMPSPMNIVGLSQLEEAFRHMQSGKNSGKTVIEFEDDDQVPIVPSKLPTYNFDSDATYVIAGGLGGLGRSAARWMVDRGAKNLILLSRSTQHSESVRVLLNDLREMGVKVETPACDISDEKALSTALGTCRHLPPIKGCLQAAMVLKVIILRDLKVYGTVAVLTRIRIQHSRRCRCTNTKLLSSPRSKGPGIYTIFCLREWTSSSSFLPWPVSLVTTASRTMPVETDTRIPWLVSVSLMASVQFRWTLEASNQSATWWSKDLPRHSIPTCSFQSLRRSTTRSWTSTATLALPSQNCKARS